MARKKVIKQKHMDRILILCGSIAAVVLLAVGGLAWWAYSFTTSNVHNELAAQKIYFPDKGSAEIKALPVADQTKVNQYAGQQVVNGDQAKVFANNYIAVHLNEVAGGKTYAQVSNEALANPSDAKLQAQANTLFKGETLRGLLLGDAYAFWTVGHIAEVVSVVAFAGGALMVLLVLRSWQHLITLHGRP